MAYTDAWYDGIRSGSRRSAEVVLPIVLDLVRPRTVIDVGCGVGTWTAAAQRMGASACGIDGAHVRAEQLEIQPERFTALDLSDGVVDLCGERFDLALSLEVAEHLPLSAARPFVASLCALAPVVLFSAAVPHQPGRDHVNCQWQSWWSAMFGERGYEMVDCVRPAVWSDARVAWWYRQNTLLYARDASPALRDAHRDWPLDVVHPEHHKYMQTRRA